MTQNPNRKKPAQKNKPTLISSKQSTTSTNGSTQSSAQSMGGSQNLNSGLPPMTPDMDMSQMLNNLSSQNPNPNPPTSGSKKSGGRNYKYDKLKEQIVEQVGGVGMLMTLLPKTSADGMVILNHSEPLADKLVACAKENEQFYKVLETVLTGTVWTALTVEVVAIVGAIMANHGVNPLAMIARKKPDANDLVSELSQPIAA